MKISVLVSDPSHPVVPFLTEWKSKFTGSTHAEILNKKKDLTSGDILFLVSCAEMIGPDIRKNFKYTLVLHAGDLPKDRGWSPHIWSILEGAEEIVLSLLDAKEPVDSGDIWHKVKVSIPRHALYDEINEKLFRAEVQLMDWAVANIREAKAQVQDSQRATFRRKRTPADSQIDPNRSLAEQFNLLRVADPNRFPAFFELEGHRYDITIKKRTGAQG